LSPYNLIHILNPIIKEWGNYFGLGNFLRIFYRLDHFIWYRTWRYLRRKFDKFTIKNLIEKFYKKIETPAGRMLYFYGVYDINNKNFCKRKNSVIFLLRLSHLNNRLPAYMFCPNSELLKSSYYNNQIIFDEYNLKLIKLRVKKGESI